MDRSTMKKQGTKKRKWLAVGLCAASFVTGQMVWGQAPTGVAAARIAPVTMEKAAEENQPRTILNDYLAAKATAGGTSASGLKPAAIQAVAELPLDPASMEAKPQSFAARSAGTAPALAGTKPGSGAAVTSAFEAKPLLTPQAP